jgi:hypothetical protein
LGRVEESETILLHGSTVRGLSATKPVDDHAGDHFDIRSRTSRVVSVVSLRLAI